MLTIDRKPDGILVIKADGQLTTQDYVDFVPRFENLVGDRPTAMLIELGPEFTGWTLPALWRDVQFDVEHWRAFGRMAVVGDRLWEKWATETLRPVSPGSLRFFHEERDEALAWLRGPAEGAPATITMTRTR